MDSEQEKYIFCYGYNHPQIVADLLGVNLSEVLDNSIPCTLKGYKRVFAEEADDFEDTSVATIIPDSNSEIKSYAFKVKESLIWFIDKFEEYPNMYDRVIVYPENNGEQFEAYVYTMNDLSKFKYPCESYLKGVGQTISAHYYLSNQIFDFNNINIDIVQAKEDKYIGESKIKLELEEYPELIQEKISEIINS